MPVLCLAVALCSISPRCTSILLCILPFLCSSVFSLTYLQVLHHIKPAYKFGICTWYPWKSLCGICSQLQEAHTSRESAAVSHTPQAAPIAKSTSSLVTQISAKQKRIEALEQAARAAQAQLKTDRAEHQQQVWQLQQQLLSQERQSSHAQAGSSHSHSTSRHMAVLPQPKQHLLQLPNSSGLSISSLQELLYASQGQLAEQSEQIARLQQEANVADTQLEKLSNLLQAQEAHTQRLELQLDSKTDTAKSRFAKVRLTLCGNLV